MPKTRVRALARTLKQQERQVASNSVSPFALPLMFAELALASCETVWHRTALMATGACTAAEYDRMVHEKMRALQLASVAMMTGQAPDEVLRPFHKRAVANAMRLREK